MYREKARAKNAGKASTQLAASGPTGAASLSSPLRSEALPQATKKQGLAVLGALPVPCSCLSGCRRLVICSLQCNYLLRMLAPAVISEHAQDHDAAVLSALSALLGTGVLPQHACDVAQLPLSLGGLGLVPAARNSVLPAVAF